MRTAAILGGLIALGTLGVHDSFGAILIDFAKDQGNNRGPWQYSTGDYYNRVVANAGETIGTPGNGVSDPQLTPLALVTTTNQPTDISLFVPNYKGFEHATKGNGVAFTYDGITFDATAMGTWIADNAGAGRDGVSTFRIMSDTQYYYVFKIVSSQHGDLADGDPPSEHVAEGDHLVSFNIGGAYNLATRSFVGGTTQTIDAAAGVADRAGVTLSGQSVYDSELQKYVIEVHMGYAKTGVDGNIAPINAMHIDYTPVPEPAALGLAGLAALVLTRRTRRA